MKPLQTGQVVIVKGGKYNGMGAQIRKIYAEHVDVLINGKITKLKIERVTGGAANEQN